MGSCYSHKAGSGNYTYTTVRMASTKLEDSSRLARPTPYSRASAAAFTTRKGMPATKADQTVSNNQFNNMNVNPLPSHSSIPRFSLTASKQETNQNLTYSSKTRCENSSLNVINNNAKPASQFSRNVTPVGQKNKSKTSKSFPDSISKPLTKSTNKLVVGKSIPKFSPHGASFNQRPLGSQITFNPGEVASLSEKKSTLSTKYDRMLNSNSSDLQAELCKSSCIIQPYSPDSITDIDSGLGNSLSEKNKQEDGDTLKDVERLSCNLFSYLQTPKTPRESATAELNANKPPLKCPIYKRGLNGKWIRVDVVSPKEGIKAKSSYQSLVETPFEKNDRQMPSIIKFPSKKLFPEISGMNSGPVKNSLMKNLTSSPLTACGNVKNLQKSSSIGDNSSISESDDKSDGLGSVTKSPTSDVENRDFLIDDEISDQPNLISVSQEKNSRDISALSLQQSVTELYALSNSVKAVDCKTRERLGSDNRDSLILGSELGSSCSSIASDDMMLDYEKRIEFPDGTINEGLASPVRKLSDLEIVDDQLSELGLDKLRSLEIEDKSRKRLHRRLSNPAGFAGAGKDEWRSRSISCPLRPPRSMSVSEAEDGSVVLDSSSYRLLSQDLNGVKTLLLRLKGVIQEADTISPFDQVNMKNLLYQSLVLNDSPSVMSALSSEQNGKLPEGLSFENADLRRQLVLMQQELEDKNRTIHLLQQQMTKYANWPSVFIDEDIEPAHANAATQTERPKSLPSSFSSSSVEDGSMETLVRITQHTGYF